ncbi:MAG: hypothetical protein WDA00_05575 [Eubacteriales bacterium]
MPRRVLVGRVPCHRLHCSLDGKMVYNPTHTTLYFEYDRQHCSVAPGERLSLA